MNANTLALAMPGLSSSLAAQYVGPNDAAMIEFGITNLARSQMWLAQVGHESASLRYFEEIASGSAYEGRQDLGNTQPGDGVRFKGRGPIQITGRYNYTQASRALGVDLVSNPGLAAQPQYAFRISAWWWSANGLNGISDTRDVIAATRRINGGLNGLADRQSRYARVLTLGEAVIPTGVAMPPATTSRRIRPMIEIAGGQVRVLAIPPNSRIWMTTAGDTVWVEWNITKGAGNYTSGDANGRLGWAGWEIPWQYLDNGYLLYVHNKVAEQPPVVVTIGPR